MEKISINDLVKLRKMIFLIIDILENNINHFSDLDDMDDKNKKLIKFLIGERENVVSILTKLINSLVKVIPLEEKILPKSNNDNKILEEDVEILKRYIDRCNFVFNKK